MRWSTAPRPRYRSPDSISPPTETLGASLPRVVSTFDKNGRGCFSGAFDGPNRGATIAHSYRYNVHVEKNDCL